jgi:hypothetical protein
MVFLAPCARARPVADAAIQLRLLREAPPDDALLIIGYVRKPPEDDVTPLAAREPLAGARIAVTGSSGTKIVASDRDGIYELAGLRPDTYTLRLLDLPEGQYALDHTVPKRWLMNEKLIVVHFYVGRKGKSEAITQSNVPNSPLTSTSPTSARASS